MIISFHHVGGLNLLLNTLNIPMLVLHFFPSSFRICINLSPSWPSQFSIIGTLSLSCILLLLVINVLYLYFGIGHFLKHCVWKSSQMLTVSLLGHLIHVLLCTGLALLTTFSALWLWLLLFWWFHLLLALSPVSCCLQLSLPKLPYVSLPVFYFLVCLVWRDVAIWLTGWERYSPTINQSSEDSFITNQSSKTDIAISPVSYLKEIFTPSWPSSQSNQSQAQEMMSSYAVMMSSHSLKPANWQA